MNLTFFICWLFGLLFAIEARCLPRTDLWQPQLSAEGEESCSAPSLLHSIEASSATAGEIPKLPTSEIERGASAVAPSSVTLTKYVHEWASVPTNTAGTCSQQPPKLEPESKPESSYPEWECKQELKQHKLPEPEVPKRRTVTLTGSEMGEVVTPKPI